MSKTCAKCGVLQPLTEYTAQASRPSGRRPHCKSCVRAARSPKSKNKFMDVICIRCGIEHRLWQSTFQKREARGTMAPTACVDCVSELKTGNGAVIWSRYIADKARA